MKGVAMRSLTFLAGVCVGMILLFTCWLALVLPASADYGGSWQQASVIMRGPDGQGHLYIVQYGDDRTAIYADNIFPAIGDELRVRWLSGPIAEWRTFQVDQLFLPVIAVGE